MKDNRTFLLSMESSIACLKSLFVSLIARFMYQPCESHWWEAKIILRNVSGTNFFGLFYNATNDSNVVAYTDEDWEGILDDRKSTSEYVSLFERILIFWSSNKQLTITLSTVEAK
jgi:hypothetical protein